MTIHGANKRFVTKNRTGLNFINRNVKCPFPNFNLINSFDKVAGLVVCQRAQNDGVQACGCWR